jgi:hypothetical protein
MWRERIRSTTRIRPSLGVHELPSSYKYNHPTLANEYYLIENRQRTGRDSAMPDDGLAIWHIDTNGNNSNQQMTPASHYLVTLVQADGQWDLENNRNGGDATDLWTSPQYTACTPLTTPNTGWWNGDLSGLFIEDISVSGSTMWFTFRPGVWVDCNYGGSEVGTFNQPWNTLAEGVAHVGAGGTAVIKTGSSPETLTITKKSILQSYGGTATIGQ